MQRRRFIQYTLIGLAAATLPIPDLIAGNSFSENIEPPELLSFIQNKEEVMEVGREYRALFPHEDSLKTLENSLVHHTFSLNHRIEEDFETGKTLILKGWVLSLTEARQCALYSIVATQPMLSMGN